MNSPEAVQQILHENHRVYKKSLAYTKLRMLLGNGLFTSEGEFWLRQRRMAQPAFHRDMLAQYVQYMATATQQMALGWQQQSQVGVTSALTHLTLRIISKTILGIELNSQGQVIEQHLPGALQFMINRITSAINTPLFIPTAKNRQFKQSVRALNTLIEQLIAYKQTNNTGNDLLTALMRVTDAETGQGMSQQQLRDEMLTFYLAGHETTAIAASWLIYLLGKHPDKQLKVKQEVNRVLQGATPTSENIAALTYTTYAIKEAMRLYAPVWILSREAMANTQVLNYKIHRGNSIVFSPYMIHRHPKYWPNAEAFEPERFEHEASFAKYTYFPFGGGPRLCIGNNFAMTELKVIIAVLLQHGSIELLNKQQPGFELSLTLRPGQEIYINGLGSSSHA